MAHCYSVGVNIDGKEREICTTHVPGNESLRRDVEAGRNRKPSRDEIGRSVEYYRRHGDPHNQVEPKVPTERGRP